MDRVSALPQFRPLARPLSVVVVGNSLAVLSIPQRTGRCDGTYAEVLRDLLTAAGQPVVLHNEARWFDFAVHALRLMLVHRIWMRAVNMPEFSPRHGVTRESLLRRLLRLDVEEAATLLDQVFPAHEPPSASLDYGEPPSPRHGGYGREHAELMEPLRELFAMVREASAVVSLECGAFG